MGTLGTTEIDYAYAGVDGDNGNLTSITNDGNLEKEYEYDAENRLLKTKIYPDYLSDPTDYKEITYLYDADGVRISKTVTEYVDGTPGTPATVNYLVDKNRSYAQVLEERDGSGTLNVRYVYGHDLISQTRGSAVRYYHYDGQLSTRQLTNDDGSQVTDSYTYDAFGRLIETDAGNTTVNNYLYTGEQLDSHDLDNAPAVQDIDDTTNYYLRARYYQPGTGRFMSRDPFGGSVNDPISLHKYLYANVNPIDNIDPSGQVSLIGTVVTSAIIGICATLGYAYTDSPMGAVWGAIGGVSTVGIVLLYASMPILGPFAEGIMQAIKATIYGLLAGFCAYIYADAEGKSASACRLALVRGWAIAVTTQLLFQFVRSDKAQNYILSLLQRVLGDKDSAERSFSNNIVVSLITATVGEILSALFKGEIHNWKALIINIVINFVSQLVWKTLGH
jgi:RHS repeat-associated protein